MANGWWWWILLLRLSYLNMANDQYWLAKWYLWQMMDNYGWFFRAYITLISFSDTTNSSLDRSDSGPWCTLVELRKVLPWRKYRASMPIKSIAEVMRSILAKNGNPRNGVPSVAIGSRGLPTPLGLGTGRRRPNVWFCHASHLQLTDLPEHGLQPGRFLLPLLRPGQGTMAEKIGPRLASASRVRAPVGLVNRRGKWRDTGSMALLTRIAHHQIQVGWAALRKSFGAAVLPKTAATERTAKDKCDTLRNRDSINAMGGRNNCMQSLWDAPDLYQL